MSWPIRATREVYANPWIRVVEDEVERPDGAAGIYGVLEVRHTAVFVVAVTEADEVLLVTVDRHTVGPSVEVPAGGTDGEDPLEAARRELLEETGYEAAQWREIGRMNALNGICRAPEVVFLATGLAPAGSAGHSQAEEGISDVRAVPWPEVVRMMRAGEITDGETVAALCYAAMELGRLA
ncbi:NUDIX domain-containing protein [Agromyces sp. CFH 90414]|uniref:NUDIX domain-containing protein n=1 Tax=Agromyces agglutinans TaxID=2662258 RepID=A0A6I2F9W6_9MICO|nr:NUDIX hydrolase [Agromyces agglutinans]MRG61111.1 NUDIX domain-containing protein [Agromyces agglutinans]